ncbi:hypothetical protein E1B28_013087 [Marasmius oreades]|uniref:receptor protein-tyrosine kinase n=1 Tax=Marasmius oreades TaxID=181124 RepID=A0A9P7UNN2_9AGAR|nr:uncharacterized protein E1B28_013087 [Marasmius oreades]KAG7087106.1 hypothetical protein E1B28_013087 [Marasmius oreades]
MCLTTSALRIVPPLPLTVTANRNHTVTWIRTHYDIDDVPPDIDLPEAIPVNGSPTQSFEDDNDDFIGPKAATSADIRSEDLDGGGETNDLNDEDENQKNGSVTVYLRGDGDIQSISAVTLSEQLPGQKTFHTAVGSGPTATASIAATTTAITPSNTTSLIPGSNSSVSSTGSGSTQTATPSASNSANSNVNPTLAPAPFAPPTNATPNTGAIAGGVVGGVLVILVFGTVVFYILKRRKIKLKHNLDPTPYLDTIPVSGSDAPYMDIKERKMQMVRQRESLERELEAYEQASQESNSRAGDIPDGPFRNGGYQEGDIVQVLRRMEVLTQRIATLEAGMAPPDYSSRTS